MQIIAGRTYKTRDGRKVTDVAQPDRYLWFMSGRIDGFATPGRWRDDGVFVPPSLACGQLIPQGIASPFDIVAEWTDADEQAANSATLAQDGQTQPAGPETAGDGETPPAGQEAESDDDLKGWLREYIADVYKQADTMREAVRRAFDEAHSDTDPQPSLAPYEPLRLILNDALAQAATGKGHERHSNGEPWTDQPICTIGRQVGIGFNTGQALKKTGEAMGMLSRNQRKAAEAEILGAINYLASAVLLIREGK